MLLTLFVYILHKQIPKLNLFFHELEQVTQNFSAKNFVPKYFAKLTGKHLTAASFLTKFQVVALQHY